MSNDDDQKSDEERIHRMDTVPPPNGEEDPYSAATRVGPMANAVVEEMMHAAQRKATELAQRAAAKTAKNAAPAGPGTAASAEARPATSAPVAPSPPQAPQKPAFPPAPAKVGPAPAREPGPRDAEAPGEKKTAASDDDDIDVVRAYDEDDEDDNAATMLSLKAKPPSITQAAPPLAAVVLQSQPDAPRTSVRAEAVRAPIPYHAHSTREAPAFEPWVLVALAAGAVILVAGVLVFLVIGH